LCRDGTVSEEPRAERALLHEKDNEAKEWWKPAGWSNEAGVRGWRLPSFSEWGNTVYKLVSDE